MYRDAGYVPPTVTAREPAPSDASPTAPSSVHSLLVEMLAGEWEELQDWAVARLGRSQMLLPHGLLPVPAIDATQR